MLDILFVFIVIAFFAASILMIYALANLKE